MSASPTTTRISRAGIATAISCALATTAFTGVAAATTVTKVDGNPSCADVAAGMQEYKIDPVPQGSASRGAFSIDVADRAFDWTSTSGVDVVIVKGGPNANIYRYSPEATSDNGLTAPVNPSNGQTYGLSHITFCWDGSTTPPPTPPQRPGPCEPGGPEMKPDGTPCLGKAEPPAAPPASNPPAQPAQSAPPASTPAPAASAPAPFAVSASSSVPPTQVLGGRAAIRRAVVASARMSGPRRCVTRSFTQVIDGRGIRRITMRVNGRVVRRMTGGQRRYAVRIDPRRYAGGVVRVQASVEYVAASGRRAQTLSATVLRCAQQVARVRFTG